ncbi:MAG: ABC transporter ATP-binding protein [Hyphomicrobiaceae bacterium]
MILALDDIKLSLGGRPILKGVSLKLDKGEIYGLVGPNGAGKSTTIAVALGLLPVSSGSVRLFNRDPRVHGDALRARIGALPEQNGFHKWMTAEEYLAYFASLYRLEYASADLAARIGQVGLQAATGLPISTYSRGMKQRLGLARALIADPRLLVLDEPTNGLDPRGRREIHDIFLALVEKGTAILLCTHLLDDVERLCSRVGFIVDGRTVAEGSIGELLQSRAKTHRFRVRLAGELPTDKSKLPLPVRILFHEGEWAIVDIPADTAPAVAWRDLVFRGWPITEIVSAGGGLEELYMDLTQANSEPHRRAA